MPLARFAEYAAEAVEGFASAVRMACEPCNLSKHDRELARFVLDRWSRGSPVRQALGYGKLDTKAATSAWHR